MTFAIAVLAAILVIFIALTPQGRTAFHTALFVSQVLRLPGTPQSWFTAEPLREQVSFQNASGTGAADVYRPPNARGSSPRAGVLIFLGANAAGRDDPDVVNFGNALARSGFVAMFYWSPTMGLRHNLDPEEIENLVWAFQYLAGLDYVDHERVGMGGICVGASFALVAAADPRIRDQVSFVNAFGPYYNATDLFLQIASRSRFGEDGSEDWQPDQLTLRVFANELIETLEDPADRKIMSRLHLERTAVPEEELHGLSRAAQRIQQLLDGTSLEEAEAIIQGLPVEFRSGLESISPSAHVGDVSAKVAILHDRKDQLIPAAESRRLFEAMEPRGQVYYTELQGFDHVRPGSGLWGAGKDGVRLFRHTYGIIRVIR